MSAVMVIGAAVGALAGGCEKQSARPFTAGQFRSEPAVRPPVVDVCETRPEWWSDKPIVRGTMMSVCASAEHRDLLVARRLAVEEATHVFASATGHAPSEGEMQADSIRLRDGTFRAYVRVSGPKRAEMATQGR